VIRLQSVGLTFYGVGGRGDIVLALGLLALVLDRLFRRCVERCMGYAHDFDALDTCVVA
jgi:hypothetical protein